MKRQFTDFHCHLLPSVDDGSSDQQESLAMARILAGFGFSVVHCTPHRIKGCYDNDPDMVQQSTRYLQRLVHEAGINLKLVAGTEHYLDEFLVEMLPGALTTGSSRYLLVEAPFRAGADMLPSMVAGVISRGLVPLIAHPERCGAFEPGRDHSFLGAFSFLTGRQKKTDLQGSVVMSLKGAGCRYQGNLGSFAGFYGSEIKQRAILFLKEGVYSCLGSDGHRSDQLERLLSAGFETVVATVGEKAAHRLLAGTDLK